MIIGVSQINTKAGDLASTADRMASISQVAVGRGVDLLVFPVAALTGPVVVDYSAQDAFLLDLVDVLSDLATRVSCDCLVPVVVPLSDVPVIEAVLLRDGVATPLRFGSWVKAGSPAGQGPGSVPHGEFATLEAAGSRVGLAFSYEDMDDWCEDAKGIDVLCYLSSYGFAVDDPSSALGAALSEGRFIDDAAESGAWIVGVGSLGGYGTQVFCGSSFVLSPDGRLAGASPAFEEDLLVAEVGKDARLEEGFELTQEVFDERYHLWQSLVLGIRDYVHKLGREDVVLALDGSLSSMLLSVLATDALGPTHVHVLLCMEDDSPRLADVPRLSRALRVDVRIPWLSDPSGGLTLRDLAPAHLRAIARESDAVVLSAADKTGLALEPDTWCPSCGSLAPLGDVWRIDVLDVARLRNTVSSVIPNLRLVPQDLPDVGLSSLEWYLEPSLERIDATLAAHVEGERTLAETVASVGDEELVGAVLSRMHRGEEQRVSRPPCLIMTTRTLSDARMPLGFAWHDTRLTSTVEESLASLEGVLRQALGEQGGVTSSRSSAHEGQDGRQESYEGAIREALELLQDLSMGSAPGRLGLFSEN